MYELLGQWSPLVDSILIGLSGVFLVRGLIAIRRGRAEEHHRNMIVATSFAALFLIVYVIRYLVFAPKIFAGEGAVRVIYLFILITHTILATVLGPLVLVVLFFALRGRFVNH